MIGVVSSLNLVLAGVIVLDAYTLVLRNRTKGQRHELLAELETQPVQENETMYQKDRTLIAICAIAVTGCVAIVAIFAMFFLATQKNVQPVMIAGSPQVVTPKTAPAQDVWQLTSGDGQPLLLPFWKSVRVSIYLLIP